MTFQIDIGKETTVSERNAVSAGSSGVGFTGLLALLFIALKLTGVIHWSWIWVLAPIWISWLIALFFICCVLVIMGIAFMKDPVRKKK